MATPSQVNIFICIYLYSPNSPNTFVSLDLTVLNNTSPRKYDCENQFPIEDGITNKKQTVIFNVHAGDTELWGSDYWEDSEINLKFIWTVLF